MREELAADRKVIEEMRKRYDGYGYTTQGFNQVDEMFCRVNRDREAHFAQEESIKLREYERTGKA